MGEPARDHAIMQLTTAGHPQPLVVQEGALATFGDVEFVVGGIIDQAGDDGVFAL